VKVKTKLLSVIEAYATIVVIGNVIVAVFCFQMQTTVAAWPQMDLSSTSAAVAVQALQRSAQVFMEP
jgi:hypothetical protein